MSVIDGSSESSSPVSAVVRRATGRCRSSASSPRVRRARHRHLELALLAVRERPDEDMLPFAETDGADELDRPLAQRAVARAQVDRPKVAGPTPSRAR